MKQAIFLATLCCAVAASAAVVNLKKGANPVVVRGEIVAVEAYTESATQAVSVKQVVAKDIFTNAVKTVETPHRRYDFAVTNWDGNASISTNVLDRFDYSEWRMTIPVTNVVGGVTSVYNRVVSRIAGGVVTPSDVTVTNVVPGGKAFKERLVFTNDVVSAAASGGHLFQTISDKWFLLGKLVVDCGENDTVVVTIKER